MSKVEHREALLKLAQQVDAHPSDTVALEAFKRLLTKCCRETWDYRHPTPNVAVGSCYPSLVDRTNALLGIMEQQP